MAEVAVAIGVSVAVSALSMAVYYLTKPDVPKPKDQTILAKSQYGFAIPKPYGTVRISSCNIFWAKKPKKQKSDEGGGKGSPKQQETVYLQNFAFTVAYEQINNIEKIYFSKELVFNNTSDGEEVSDGANELEANHLEIYYGTLEQTPSPHIEQYEGVGNVNAFRKVAYIVVKNYPSKVQAFPTIDVVVKEADNRTVGAVITDVCQKVNLDSSLLEIDGVVGAKIVKGAIFEQSNDAPQSLIEELQKAYFFFPRDLGYKLQFIDLDTPKLETVFEIPSSSLGAVELRGGDSEIVPLYEQTFVDPITLPSQVSFDFLNPDKDYDMGSQPAFDEAATHVNQASIRSSLCFTDKEGSEIAWKMLAQSIQQTRKFEKISLLPNTGSGIVIGQLLNLYILDQPTTIQVTQKETADNYLVELSAIIYETIKPNKGGLVDTTYYPVTTPIGGGVTAEVIAVDTPLKQDSELDFGIYLGIRVTSGSWSDGVIMASDDGGASYTKLTSFSGSSVTGLVTQTPTATTDFYPEIQTEGEFVVKLDEDKTLDSITEANFLNRKNMALVGKEFICWQNAELIAEKTYKLSKLIRGLRGTEWAMSQHSQNEKFLLFRGVGNNIIRYSKGNTTDIGKNLRFKAVHSGQSIDNVSNFTTVTITGESYKPYAPVDIEVSKDTVGNYTFVWQRRDRHAGEATNYNNLPLSEKTEAWEIEILSGNSAVRLLKSSLSSIVYTNQNQTADFGSPNPSFTVKIYQISDVIGRGYAATIAVSGQDTGIPVIQPPPVVYEIVPQLATYGDTVKLIGKGLSQLIAVAPNKKLATNLTIISDEEASFTLNNFATETDYIYFNDIANSTITNPANFPYKTPTRLLIDSRAFLLPKYFYKNSNFSVDQSMLGAIILVDTTNATIQVTIDQSLLSIKNSFNFNVINTGLNQVQFIEGTDDVLIARSFVLLNQHDGCTWYYDYHDQEHCWYGVGAFY